MIELGGYFKRVQKDTLNSLHIPQDPKLWQATKALVALSERCSQVILDIRERGFRSWQKEGGTLCTDADVAANDILLQELPGIRPCPVVSEESIRDIDINELALHGEWWLADPLDGTATYKAGYEGFAVCVALIRDARPVAGVISVPLDNTVYFAARGYGSHRLDRDKGIIESLSAERDSARSFRFAGFYHYSDEQRAKLDNFLRRNKLPASVVQPVSAAIKYCLVAEGEFDMAGGWRSLEAWDIAAADILVTEAGGRFVDFSTCQPYLYDVKHLSVRAPMAIAKDVVVSPF